MDIDRNDLPPWYRPVFSGFAGKIGSMAWAGRKDWAVVAPSTWGGYYENVPMAAISVTQVGGSRMYQVNTLDPGTGDGYVSPENADKGRVIPARRI